MAAYGEEAYTTVLSKAGLPVDALGDQRKIPDLVGYTGGQKNYEIAFVYEAKVIYDEDADGAVKNVLQELNNQLRRAKLLCPNATILGVVYAIKLGHSDAGEQIDLENDDDISPPEYVLDPITQQINYPVFPSSDVYGTQFFANLSSRIQEQLPDSDYDWVSYSGVEPLEKVKQCMTEMVFPSTFVSVGIGVRQLR